MVAFLNDTGSWRSAADAAAVSAVLGGATGLMIQSRTADDAPRAIGSAAVLHDSGGVTRLAVSNAGIAYGEMLPAGPASLTVDGVTRRIVLPAGGSRVHVIKPGPWIEAVEPAAGRSWPLVLAPGMLVSIRGSELNTGASELYLADKAVPVLSASDNRLIALLPEEVIGRAELRLRNSAGQHAVHVFLESAFPALFLREGLAAAVHSFSGEPVSAGNPAAPGEIISVFLTGLGTTTTSRGLPVALHQPVVRIAERQCEILYAGRAPALPGIDQVNCRLPPELPSGAVRLQVTSGNRTGAAALAVR